MGFGNSTFAQRLGPSYYQPFSGDKFFLLTEASFTSQEIAKVRLEAPGRGQLEGYSGVDIFVYAIPDPDAFLTSQRNLHRPSITGNFTGEGLSNPMIFIWDNWYKKSRLTMRSILSQRARTLFLRESPEMHYVHPESYQSKYAHNSQFGKLSDFKRIDRFRYPIWHAKPLDPVANTNLSGSNITKPKMGNLYIPLGKMNPGLYLVEAMIGQFRAVTLVFVSDTVAITKMSGDQQFIWSVNKINGKPSPNTKILLTDGMGVLKSGETGKDGVLSLNKKDLSQNYIIGRDAQGGVFVSENFYYDAELYANKVYLFTDRPAYQPGETVFIKLIGRKFESSSKSTGLPAGEGRLVITDPSGTPIVVKKLQISEETGADTKFSLPSYAGTGGYNISLTFQGSKYNGFFQVATFAKPHFQVEILPEKRLFRTGEAINGRIKVTYPNGDPVGYAKVEFKARSQKLTVVEDEIRYLGLFPIQLSHQTSTADKNGIVRFDLPPTTDPSRYILRVRVSDNSSYRVTSVKEVLVHEGYTFFTMNSENNFAKAGDKVTFNLKSHTLGKKDAKDSDGVVPGVWEAIRLTDQTKTTGDIQAGADKFSIQFKKSGNYSIFLKDANGNVLGSRSFMVEGEDYVAVPGSIDVVLDKEAYRIGDKAKALITFSEPINEALITLERDNVSRHCLMSEGADWISLDKASDRQWKAEIEISEEFSPNITISFVYVINGQYVFKNKGIKVAIPEVEITVKTDEVEFRPGEKVTVQLETRLKGKPVPAWVTLGVVDEMIYVLQPEIAPKISDFFYHRRRNQVKTSSSLNFHTFDVATKSTGMGMAALNNTRARPLKFREGSRREDVNTALWIPNLKTDDSGKASFSFIMPDSITRWRLTARAITAEGAVGQKRSFFLTEQKYFLKWTGPTVFRNGDQPKIAMVIFNHSDAMQTAKISAEGMGVNLQKDLTLRVGSNFIEIPIKPQITGDVTTGLMIDGKMVDQLATRVTVVPRRWKSTQSMAVALAKGETRFPAPSRSFNLNLSFAGNSSQSFLQVADNLIDYPYGCVEQTSSKLIPLSIAYMHMKNSGLSHSLLYDLHNRLSTSRFRLVQMAGPKATFGWWGNMTGHSAFMTAYAYYADWLATRALGIDLPPEHWDKLLEVFRQSREPSLLQQVSILWLANEMKLPVKSLVEGMANRLGSRANDLKTSETFKPARSYIIEEEMSAVNFKLGLGLLAVLAKDKNISLGPQFKGPIDTVFKEFETSNFPIAKTVWLLKKAQKNLNDEDRLTAEKLLREISYEMATVDRAFMLIFINKILGWNKDTVVADINPGDKWEKTSSHLLKNVWKYTGNTKEDLVIQTSNSDVSKMFGRLVYDTYAKEVSKLPIEINRRFHRLSPAEYANYAYNIRSVSGTKVDSKGLYVDEITIRPSYNGKYKFGLLEIPIPPGADIEQPTYGMKIMSGDNTVGISSAKFVTGDRFYSIPIEELDSSITFRFLIRFSQKGSFVLPRTRYFRMYDPTMKAFEQNEHRIIVQ